MDKVMKESFFEATIKFNEEFDNAELAAQSDKPGEKASVKILDLKHEMSKIKQIIKKEQDGSQKGSGTEASARKDNSKNV